MTPENFSIIDGGPTYLLLHRLGLRGTGWGPVGKCFAVALLVTWLPLLALSLLPGNAFGNTTVPFLKDINAAVRFLLALPLLLLAEPRLAVQSAGTLQQFWQENLVTDDCRAGFTAALALAARRCSLLSSELVLLVLALASSLWMFAVHPSAVALASWQFTPALHPTLAGIWYAVVANTLFDYLIYRWIWRLIIWWELLARIARLPLRLIPTHPDRAAGLGFLALGQEDFSLIIFALSLTTAALGANKIIYNKLPFSTQEVPLLLMVLLALLIIFGPLIAFSAKLFNTKIQGLLQYGSLAARYTQAFEEKWLDGNAAHTSAEELLGHADLQSLADLGTSYEVIRQIRLLPFASRLLTAALLAALLPFLLLALATTPVETILEAIPRMVLKIIGGQ